MNRRVQRILQQIGFMTNKDENFVLANDIDSGIVILGCEANLNFLCLDADDVFADGTFKCCLTYFQQLYTIHGFKNGHYIPLVFCLLSSKVRRLLQENVFFAQGMLR